MALKLCGRSLGRYHYMMLRRPANDYTCFRLLVVPTTTRHMNPRYDSNVRQSVRSMESSVVKTNVLISEQLSRSVGSLIMLARYVFHVVNTKRITTVIQYV